MDLRAYLAIVDAIAAVQTREEVSRVLARILAADLEPLERRALRQRLAAKARTLGSSLGVEVIRELLSEPSSYESPRITRMSRGSRGDAGGCQ
jgi:hypothetical protein